MIHVFPNRASRSAVPLSRTVQQAGPVPRKIGRRAARTPNRKKSRHAYVPAFSAPCALLRALFALFCHEANRNSRIFMRVRTL